MKTRQALSFLPLFALVGSVFLATPLQASDIGIYADEAATGAEATVTPDTPFPVYLVLSHAGVDVRGWECVVAASPNLRIADWVYEGQALNIAEAPRFAVGLARPLPAADHIVLARATCVVTDDQPGWLRLAANDPSSVTPPAPAFVGGDREHVGAVTSLRTSQSPAFTINESGPAAGARPAAVSLDNQPNPFNPRTTIRFALPAPGHTTVAVYGLDGRRVATLVDGDLPAGEHRTTWDGRDSRGQAVASGTYVYRLEGAGVVATRRMVLVK